MRTSVRTFLYNIAENYKKTNYQEIFEIEGEKYILYPTTGTFEYPVPLYVSIKEYLLKIFSEGLEFPQIGTDESGKGDVFGPLVVSGVLLDKEDIPKVIDLGIKDSKKLSDKLILEIKNEIEKTFFYEVVLISPKKYNELYMKMKNVNRILAWAHARTIENILSKKEAKLIIIDKFTSEEFIKSFMFKEAKTRNFIIESQGEKYFASALSSIIARGYYLEYMKKMEREYKMEFPKGAGENTNKVISEFIKKYTHLRLPEVGKMHFKNIKKQISER